MYDKGEEEGSLLIPDGVNYYGELQYIIHYKQWTSNPFDLLYLDKKTFKKACLTNGINFKVECLGENYDYLAKLTI